jgi:LEA14-like dessication related protein
MKSFSQPALRLLPLAAAFLVSGCATPQEDGAFDVSLVNITAPRDGGGGLGEASLNFTIRLQNGSPEALKVTGGSHKIYLNDVYVGQGLSNQEAEVPRLATTTQDVAVHLSTFRLIRSFHRMFESKTVSYRLESTVFAQQGSRTVRLKAAKSGTVDVEALGAGQPRLTEPR